MEFLSLVPYFIIVAMPVVVVVIIVSIVGYYLFNSDAPNNHPPDKQVG